MTYAILDNGTITRHGTASALWPDTSFAAGPNDSFLAEQGAVLIRSDAAYDPDTETLESTEPYISEGDVFNTIAAPKPPPPVVPQWVAFGAAIAGNAAVNTLVATAAQAAPVLHLMLGVGLGQAAQGDPQTFTAAWSAAVAGGLVSAELIAEMQEIAATYDLPAEFIAGLSS